MVALLAGLLDAEESFTRHPSVGHSLVKSLAGALAYDDIESVVSEVHALAGALHAVAYHRDCLVFEHLAGFFKWKFVADDDILFNSAKIHFCHIYLVFCIKLLQR